MKTDPSKKELRLFGICFGIALLIIGTRLYFKQHIPASIVFLSLGALIEISGWFVFRPILTPVNRFMGGVLKALMFIITRTALTLCFYCAVTPIGIIMRLTGKDPLHRKLDSQAETYWVDCKVKTFDKDHYLKQF